MKYLVFIQKDPVKGLIVYLVILLETAVSTFWLMKLLFM